MAADTNLLLTAAECDEAHEDLAAELDTYQVRDTVLDHSDRQAGRTKADIAARLAAANAEIAVHTATLALPELTPEMRKQTTSKLRRANDRKDNLTERGEARTGSRAFLAAVDADQIAAQVQVLTAAIAAVQQRREELTA